MDQQSKGMALILVCLSTLGAGMILHSWRVIIYSYILVIGLILTIGLGRYIQKNKSFLFFPIASSSLFFLLFALADLLGVGEKMAGGDSRVYVMGLVPTSAVFLYGVASMILVIPLFYAWSHHKQGRIEAQKAQASAGRYAKTS
ncbi:hypothetical protein [Bacillus xiapuensis]|uniref:hypothetical protein n=1 Tax=Bacillus xiapuensis TaxID=2014075 RepID=UPI000C23801D|nr:hypothetical protein [Bacillus xiapuensis]